MKDQDHAEIVTEADGASPSAVGRDAGPNESPAAFGDYFVCC